MNPTIRSAKLKSFKQVNIRDFQKERKRNAIDYKFPICRSYGLLDVMVNGSLVEFKS